MFSICVPSYNSLPYLKILYASVKRNFKLPYTFSVCDNNSTDGTWEFLQKDKSPMVHYVQSNENLGFAGVNSVLRLSKYDHIIIANSDMYFMPGSDIAIFKQIQKFKKAGIKRYMISCTLLEPNPYNPEYNYAPFGNTADEFNENGLLETYFKLLNSEWKKSDTIQYSHPIIIPYFMLKEVSEQNKIRTGKDYEQCLDYDYWPGWGIDHDIPASMYKNGCRNFIMLGDARVYHFSSKTFKQLPPEANKKDGQDIFLKKWGLTVDEFRSRMNIAKPFQEVKDEILP